MNKEGSSVVMGQYNNGNKNYIVTDLQILVETN
jgi:hypothetical protein